MSKLKGIFVCLLSIIAIAESAKSSSRNSKKTYEIISINGTSSDENLLKTNFEVESVGRGEHVVTGTIAINFEVTDKNLVAVDLYRSARNSNFKKLPIALPKKSLFSYLNTEYKLMAMTSLKDCSNLPYFEDVLKPPIGPVTYELNRCLIPLDKLPQYIPEGYYKVMVSGSGQLDWIIEIFLKVSTTKI